MKNNLDGLKDVYCFTLVQTLKSKPFKTFVLILFVIALVSMPLIELITNGPSRESKTSDISKVYVIDETGLPLADYSSIKENNLYKDIVFEYTDKSADEIENEILEDDSGAILLHITSDMGVFNMRYINSPSGKVSEMELINLSGFIEDIFWTNVISNLGVTTEQKERLEEPIITDFKFYTGEVDDIEEEEGSRFGVTFEEYYFALFAFVCITMLISYGGSGIATTIVTEKSTKLIEILLTRIKPMAIIMGKVFAMLTVTIIQLSSVVLGLGLSSLIYKNAFNSDAYLPEFLVRSLGSSVFENVTLANIIVILIMYVLGFIFYGFLAGLTGATVSKIEELREGMVVYTFLTIIGAYMGLALPIIGLQGSVPSGYAHFAFLFPISSVFVTPVYLLFGKVTISIALLAILLLVISTILVIIFTSKVYQTIILHQGNIIKFKDLISISKTSKEAR